MSEEHNEEIEREENENLDIKVPFDPNLIKVSTKPMTLGEIIDMLEHREVNLFTEYQRLPDLWDDVKKSKLIESILLRLPLPNFYFDADDENNWSVVDGLQRISTLKSFVLDKTLVLQKLEFLTEYNGLRYDELPRPFQRRILTFPITAYIIEKGTPDVVKYNIFSRINQGGLKLTPQEIRHALHQGKPAELVAELVRGVDEINENGEIVKPATPEGRAFVKVTEGKIRTKRMEDRDFATRFVSFYLIDFHEYEPDLDSFMNRGMGKIKFLSSEEIKKLKADFRAAMELAFDVFGNQAFRKYGYFEGQRSPINKALFEVFSVLFAKLSEDERNAVVANKNYLREIFIGSLSYNGEGYYQAISTGTALKDSVFKRFSITAKMIAKVLNYA